MMSAFTDKNEARTPLGQPGSKERRLWVGARTQRRLLKNGAFGNLRHAAKTSELYQDLAYGTRGTQ